MLSIHLEIETDTSDHLNKKYSETEENLKIWTHGENKCKINFGLCFM